MKNISSLIFATFLISGINAQNCTDLFISEYVEGSHNNKAIELYNPTNENIDLLHADINDKISAISSSIL